MTTKSNAETELHKPYDFAKLPENCLIRFLDSQKAEYDYQIYHQRSMPDFVCGLCEDEKNDAIMNVKIMKTRAERASKPPAEIIDITLDDSLLAYRVKRSTKRSVFYVNTRGQNPTFNEKLHTQLVYEEILVPKYDRAMKGI